MILYGANLKKDAQLPTCYKFKRSVSAIMKRITIKKQCNLIMKWVNLTAKIYSLPLATIEYWNEW